MAPYFASLPDAALFVPPSLQPLVPPEVLAARQHYERAYLNHELSLYIHYPFCVRKCPYCDFASLPLGADGSRDEDYVSLLLREFELKKELLKGRSLVSVYIGGGTPSLCDPKQMARLLAAIAPYLAPNAEISLEANPGTVDLEKLRALRAAGFNRISIGVQSFDDVMLKRLGRIHSKDDAILACTWAQQAGFTNFNIDLMHGLPGQDVALALCDVEQALALEPSHISWYELTLEEGTYFGKHPPKLPEEDILCDIELTGFDRLKDAGFVHYEVSAFSRGGTTRCYHNQNYWLYGDYLGLGAGAHQKVSLRPEDAVELSGAEVSATYPVSIWRSHNSEELEQYRVMVLALKARPELMVGLESHEVTDLGEIVFEYLLNRLRLRSDPVSAFEFYLRTGRELSPLHDDFAWLESQGLLKCQWQGDKLLAFALTAQGNLMLNDVLAQFL